MKQLTPYHKAFMKELLKATGRVALATLVGLVVMAATLWWSATSRKKSSTTPTTLPNETQEQRIELLDQEALRLREAAQQAAEQKRLAEEQKRSERRVKVATFQVLTTGSPQWRSVGILRAQLTPAGNPPRRIQAP
jgi:hypothetical protein